MISKALVTNKFKVMRILVSCVLGLSSSHGFLSFFLPIGHTGRLDGAKVVEITFLQVRQGSCKVFSSEE